MYAQKSFRDSAAVACLLLWKGKVSDIHLFSSSQNCVDVLLCNCKIYTQTYIQLIYMHPFLFYIMMRSVFMLLLTDAEGFDFDTCVFTTTYFSSQNCAQKKNVWNMESARSWASRRRCVDTHSHRHKERRIFSLSSKKSI